MTRTSSVCRAVGASDLDACPERRRRAAPQQGPAARPDIFTEGSGAARAADREARQNEQVMDGLQIAEAAWWRTYAGGGWFTIRLARRVGPRGLVYAEDVQRLMIEAIQRRVQREGLTNVRRC